jgi:hypothetical protein
MISYGKDISDDSWKELFKTDIKLVSDKNTRWVETLPFARNPIKLPSYFPIFLLKKSTAEQRYDRQDRDHIADQTI